MSSKRHYKRILCMLALCAMLLSTATGMLSCKNNVNSGDGKDTPDISDDDSESIEAIDYGGESIDFYLWEMGTLHDIENVSSPIPNATYLRNATVETKYNVNFTYKVEPGHGDNYNKWQSTLTNVLTSGDRSFDIIGGYQYYLAIEGVSGYYSDLAGNIDFSNDWWPNDYTEAAMMNNRVFVCMGNIDTSFYDNNFAIFYNKDIAADLQLDNLPDLVRDGKWTLDKLIELSKLGKKDIGGDGVMDVDKDQFGYITSSNLGIDAFFNSCDVKVATRDDLGVPTLLIDDTAHYVDVQQKVAGFVRDPNYVAFGLDSVNGKTAQMFANGQGLFLCDRVGATHTIREFADYSVLPVPKWNEEQDNYITYTAVHNSTAYLVPLQSDVEMCSTILDALSYYGWKDLKPVYYDRVVKSIYATDEDWGPMMDIVFENVEIEFTQFYSQIWGNQKSPSMMLRQVTRDAEGNGNFGSAWANNRDLFINKLADFIETYSTVEG